MTSRDDTIRTLYESGRNTVTIAQELGVDPSTVQRSLKKQGYTLHRRSTELTPEEWADIVSRYQNKERLKSIAASYPQHFGCTETLGKMLERKGIKTERLKGGHDRLPVDDTFFQSIDTEAKAYFLGWMISDGSVNGNNNAVSLEIDREDLYMLERFRETLQSGHALTPTRNCYRFSFTSEAMVHDLALYGVVPNKTYVTTMPALPDHLMPHLIRGIFDGDGTVYRRLDNDGKRRCSFGFYGSEGILVQIRQYLHDTLSLSNNKIHPKVGCSMLYYGKQKDTRAFYDYIYADAEYYLTRKRDVFDSYFANIERAVISGLCNA